MKSIFLLLLCSQAFAESLVIPVGGSRTLTVPDLLRAAVGDGRVARARAVPPKEILLTGLAPGRTTITAWDGAGKSRVFEIEVMESKLYQASLGYGPAPVVRVELEFLEVDASEGSKFGLKWPESLEGAAGGSIRGDGASVLSSYSATVSTAKGLLEALVSEGKARVLSRPRLYVRLGETVSFHSGGEFPVATSGQQEGRFYPKIEWKPFGLSMKVKPESGDGVHLSSDVDVDLSETDASLSVDGVPSLTRRQIKTKMESRDGETVVLSGLIRKTSSRAKEGTPGLASVPLLGILFSRSRESAAQTEVLIALSLSFRTRAEQERELEDTHARIGAP